MKHQTYIIIPNELVLISGDMNVNEGNKEQITPSL